MTDHTVSAFDEELQFLRAKITEMGGHAESMIAGSVAALVKNDPTGAQSIIVQDMILDNLQFELDEHVVLVIAKRQPMAIDLREVLGALRIASDLERIGDMGKNIAKRTSEIGDFTHPGQVIRGIEHLTSLALEQLKDVLDAYVNRDIVKASQVLAHDDEVDQIYSSLFRELLTYMMEDPRYISFCTHLLFCAKNIERVGDHATNIAETIIYVVTGAAAPSTHGTRPSFSKVSTAEK